MKSMKTVLAVLLVFTGGFTRTSHAAPPQYSPSIYDLIAVRLIAAQAATAQSDHAMQAATTDLGPRAGRLFHLGHAMLSSGDPPTDRPLSQVLAVHDATDQMLDLALSGRCSSFSNAVDLVIGRNPDLLKHIDPNALKALFDERMLQADARVAVDHLISSAELVSGSDALAEDIMRYLADMMLHTADDPFNATEVVDAVHEHDGGLLHALAGLFSGDDRFEDWDGDGIMNINDPDDDGDGVPDEEDEYPDDPSKACFPSPWPVDYYSQDLLNQSTQVSVETLITQFVLSQLIELNQILGY